MRIIDEKGRILGRVSVIDVLIFVCVILLGIIGIYKYVNRERSNSANKVNQKLVITFVAEEVPSYVADTLKEGKKVRDSAWMSNIGTVVSYKVEPSISYATTFQGDYVKTTKEGYNSVEVVIDGEGYFEDTGIRIDGQLFLVGKYMVMEIGESAYWGRFSSIKPIGG